MNNKENINVVLTINMGEIFKMLQIIIDRNYLIEQQVAELKEDLTPENEEKLNAIDKELRTLQSLTNKIHNTIQVFKEVEKKS